MRKWLYLLLCICLSMAVYGTAEAAVKKPKGLVVKTSSSSSVSLSWKKVKGAKGYLVYRSSNNKKYKKIATVKKNSYKNKKLLSAKIYYYKVKAFKKKQKSKYSSYVSTCTAPKVVTNLHIQQKVNNNYLLAWNKVKGISGYELYFSKDQRTYVKLGSVLSPSLNYLCKNIPAGANYSYKVRAYRVWNNKVYYGGFSAIMYIMTPGGSGDNKTPGGNDKDKNDNNNGGNTNGGNSNGGNSSGGNSTGGSDNGSGDEGGSTGGNETVDPGNSGTGTGSAIGEGGSDSGETGETPGGTGTGSAIGEGGDSGENPGGTGTGSAIGEGGETGDNPGGEGGSDSGEIGDNPGGEGGSGEGGSGEESEEPTNFNIVYVAPGLGFLEDIFEANNPTTYSKEEEVILNDPVAMEGYDFEGWFLDEACTDESIISIPTGSTGDKTIYAKMKAHTYRVIFNKNGGKGSKPSLTVTYNGSTVISNGNIFHRDDYELLWWSTEEDGSGIIIRDGQSIPNEFLAKYSDGAEITLYAQWIAEEKADTENYSVSYFVNGGTNDAENIISYEAGEGSFELKAPTLTGYEFQGWYTDAKFTERITDIDYSSKKDYILFAKWEEIKYTITYVLNGHGALGTAEEHPEEYTINSDISMINAKITEKELYNYTFLGWYTDEECTQYITKIEKGSMGNITLYAKWAKLMSVVNANNAAGLEKANELLGLINSERDKLGLAPLVLDENLCNVAGIRSQEMASTHQFSHQRIDEYDFTVLMAREGIDYAHIYCGENIGYGSDNEAVMFGLWLGSPRHYNNMMGANYTRVGIALAYDMEGVPYWTQIFSSDFTIED